jgi:two-component system, response regulator YesN
VYSLLIVDDEPLAQVGLRSMVDWASIGVSVLGACPNGERAFEEIERRKPDIVITDVRMPVLDGLGLIERCRERLSDPPAFIVLSGYADFESARRSVRSQAVDFMMKIDLDEAGLRSSVERAKRRVDELRTARSRPGNPAETGGKDPGALHRFLSGAAADAAGAGLAEKSGPRLVAFIEAGFPFPERLGDEDRERAYRCAKDMVVEIAKREAAVVEGEAGGDRFVLVLSFDGFQGDSRARARALLEDAADMVEKYFSVALSVGVGPEAAGVEGLPESFRQARACAAAGGGEGNGEAGAASPVGGRRERVAKAIARQSAEDFRAEAEEVLGAIGLGALRRSAALEACCDFLYPVLEGLEGGQDCVESLFPADSGGYRSVFSATSPDAMAPWLERLARGVEARLESMKARESNPLAAGVRAYVAKNCLGKLALADVAAAFRVSPNHLSTVFKKYSGIGFNEYVARAKVEKAKELLLAGGHRMFEVAQILGFEDAFYFSKVFKRVTGLSPREFRLRTATERAEADGTE